MAKKKKEKESILQRAFDAFCVKHKLEKSVLITSKTIDKESSNINIIVKTKTSREDGQLGRAIMDLMRLSGGLDHKSLKDIVEVVRLTQLTDAVEGVSDELNKILAKTNEEKLSPEDKKKLKAIRAKKNRLVKNGDLENAAKAREEELALLGVKK